MSALIRVVLSQSELQIEPGQRGELIVTVQNLSEIVDQYSIEAEGLEASWYTIPISEVSLFPQDEERARIQLHPPAGAEAQAGKYDFVVRVTSRENPTERTSVPATLQVLSVLAFELGLSPQRTSTAKEGVFQVRLANPSNVDLTVELSATDPEEACVYRFEPQRVIVGAGQSKGVSLIVAPKRKPPRGETARYDFTVRAVPAEAPAKARAVTGQLEHRSRMPRWALPALIIGLLLLCCGTASVAGFFMFREDIEGLLAERRGPTPTSWEVAFVTQTAEAAAAQSGMVTTQTSVAGASAATQTAIAGANAATQTAAAEANAATQTAVAAAQTTQAESFAATQTAAAAGNAATQTAVAESIAATQTAQAAATQTAQAAAQAAATQTADAAEAAAAETAQAMATQAAGATQTAEAIQTAEAAVTPSATPATPSPPTTHSTGLLEIAQTWAADLDEGAVPGDGNADIWFEAQTAAQRYVTPRNDAKIVVVGTSSVGYDGCRSAALSTNRIHVNHLPVGTYVCVLTNEGRYSQFRVNAPIGASPGKLKIGYTTWAKPRIRPVIILPTLVIRRLVPIATATP